jgi:hypothetical protein
MGNVYVIKLQAICLLEADFNWWNKLGSAGWLYTPGGLCQETQSLHPCCPYQAILLQQLTYTPPSRRTRGMQLWGLL